MYAEPSTFAASSVSALKPAVYLPHHEQIAQPPMEQKQVDPPNMTQKKSLLTDNNNNNNYDHDNIYRDKKDASNNSSKNNDDASDNDNESNASKSPIFSVPTCLPPYHTFAIAPMLKVTNLHFNSLARLISRHAVLYTEMIVASTIVHNPELVRRMLQPPLMDGRLARPWVLQLGGSDPAQIGLAVEMLLGLNDRLISSDIVEKMAGKKGWKRHDQASIKDDSESESHPGGHEYHQPHPNHKQDNPEPEGHSHQHENHHKQKNSPKLPFKDFEFPILNYTTLDHQDNPTHPFDEINLNCGCPSDKVVGQGCFGAVLMTQPLLVADICNHISDAVSHKIPVSVKCRIGINDDQGYGRVYEFVKIVSENSPVTHFIIHARKAILGKLSPAENRSIPKLKYHVVYDLIRDFPHLKFTINGGIHSLSQVQMHLQKGAHGVMLGRHVTESMWEALRNVDHLIYGDSSRDERSVDDVLMEYAKYADMHMRGEEANRRFQIVEPLFSMFYAIPFLKIFKKLLFENTRHKYHPNSFQTTMKNALDVLQLDDIQRTGNHPGAEQPCFFETEGRERG